MSHPYHAINGKHISTLSSAFYYMVEAISRENDHDKECTITSGQYLALSEMMQGIRGILEDIGELELVLIHEAECIKDAKTHSDTYLHNYVVSDGKGKPSVINMHRLLDLSQTYFWGVRAVVTGAAS